MPVETDAFLGIWIFWLLIVFPADNVSWLLVIVIAAFLGGLRPSAVKSGDPADTFWG